MTNYHAFIINEKKGSLKFYNGPSFSNNYTQPQFESASSRFTGVTFKTQQISFTIAVYAVTAEQYRKLINKQNEIIYKLGNLDREELIYKYSKELYIDDVYVYNNYLVNYIFRDNILYVEAKTLFGKFTYKFDGNKIEMMYSTLENAKPLRNTLLIYEAFKTKSDLAKNLDNLEIENTNLKLNARTTSLYTFDENTRYCNDIPLYISNNDEIINKVNKEIQPEKIKFTSEQLPDSIINKIENKNIFKKIFK